MILRGLSKRRTMRPSCSEVRGGLEQPQKDAVISDLAARLSKVNAQLSIVAPHHLAALERLIRHDNLKRRRDSIGGLYHKTCADFRKIADGAQHLPTSKKKLRGF